MDKTLAVNQKRGNKQRKNKQQQQQQQLKVVYITNPIKFNASASEFRALVQGLTGRDADVEDYARFAAAEGVGVGGQAAKVTVEGNAGEKGSDLSSTSGSTYDDGSPEMIDNFEGLINSSVWHGDVHVDVFKTLG